MYTWAVKQYNRFPQAVGPGPSNLGLGNKGEGEGVRKLLGPALFLIRFPCIAPAVIGEKIG